MKEEISDFLKFAKEKGKIKELDEAFIEYPVEEEWHKGDINNFFKEDIEKYDEYKIGDIVFVEEYKYSDGKIGKKHLFVIVEKDNYAVPIEYFAMLISSHLEKLKFSKNKLILKDNLNNLNRNSIVKTDVIYKIKNENIKYKIGMIKRSVVDEYMKNLEDLF